jgi:glycosyltransferase involved in cell wall biosynthesis
LGGKLYNMTLTLCISTYNRPAALKLCLESVLLQTRMPDEIIIGDDGSKEETKKLIDSYTAKFKIPFVHIWQPDEGFRLATIRNKCFLAAKGSYIVQIDGDLILHENFIEDHIRFASPDTFLCGGRSTVNQSVTNQLEQQGKIDWNLVYSGLSKKVNAIRSILFAYIMYLFKRGISQTKYVLGANMSFWKKDLLKVNGYNEDFVGWGKEDNDIALRLFNAAVKIRFLKNYAVVYHLYHHEASKDSMRTNEQLFDKTRASKVFYAKHGIIKD